MIGDKVFCIGLHCVIVSAAKRLSNDFVVTCVQKNRRPAVFYWGGINRQKWLWSMYDAVLLTELPSFFYCFTGVCCRIHCIDYYNFFGPPVQSHRHEKNNDHDGVWHGI